MADKTVSTLALRSVLANVVAPALRKPESAAAVVFAVAL